MRIYYLLALIPFLLLINYAYGLSSITYDYLNTNIGNNRVVLVDADNDNLYDAIYTYNATNYKLDLLYNVTNVATSISLANGHEPYSVDNNYVYTFNVTTNIDIDRVNTIDGSRVDVCSITLATAENIEAAIIEVNGNHTLMKRKDFGAYAYEVDISTCAYTENPLTFYSGASGSSIKNYSPYGIIGGDGQSKLHFYTPEGILKSFDCDPTFASIVGSMSVCDKLTGTGTNIDIVLKNLRDDSEIDVKDVDSIFGTNDPNTWINHYFIVFDPNIPSYTSMEDFGTLVNYQTHDYKYGNEAWEYRVACGAIFQTSNPVCLSFPFENAYLYYYNNYTTATTATDNQIAVIKLPNSVSSIHIGYETNVVNNYNYSSTWYLTSLYVSDLNFTNQSKFNYFTSIDFSIPKNSTIQNVEVDEGSTTVSRYYVIKTSAAYPLDNINFAVVRTDVGLTVSTLFSMTIVLQDITDPTDYYVVLYDYSTYNNIRTAIARQYVEVDKTSTITVVSDRCYELFIYQVSEDTEKPIGIVCAVGSSFKYINVVTSPIPTIKTLTIYDEQTLNLKSGNYTIDIVTPYQITQYKLENSYTLSFSAADDIVAVRVTTLNNIQNYTRNYEYIQDEDGLTNVPDNIDAYIADPATSINQYRLSFNDLSGKFITDIIVETRKIVGSSEITVERRILDNNFAATFMLVTNGVYKIVVMSNNNVQVLESMVMDPNTECPESQDIICKGIIIGSSIITSTPTVIYDVMKLDAWKYGNSIYFTYLVSVPQTNSLTIKLVNETGKYFVTKIDNSDSITYTINNISAGSKYSVEVDISHSVYGNVTDSIPVNELEPMDIVGYALSLDGASYLKVDNYQELNNLIDTTIRVTFSLPTLTQDSQAIIYKRADLTHETTIYFDGNTKQIAIKVVMPSGTKEVKTVFNNWEINKLYELTCVITQNNIKIYINSVLDTVDQNPLTLEAFTGDIYIGASDLNSNYIKMNILSLQMLNREISTVELSSRSINPEGVVLDIVFDSDNYDPATTSFANAADVNNPNPAVLFTQSTPAFMFITSAIANDTQIPFIPLPSQYLVLFGMPLPLIIMAFIANIWRRSDSGIGGLVIAFVGTIFVVWGWFNVPEGFEGQLLPLSWQTVAGSVIVSLSIVLAFANILRGRP